MKLLRWSEKINIDALPNLECPNCHENVYSITACEKMLRLKCNNCGTMSIFMHGLWWSNIVRETLVKLLGIKWFNSNIKSEFITDHDDVGLYGVYQLRETKTYDKKR